VTSELGQIEWREDGGELKPFHVLGETATAAVWSPQPGSQSHFLKCPVFECIYEGTRGPGKTDALLMDFAQHVGQGFKAEWRGVLFRRTYPELQDVIDKSLKWFPLIWPRATYNRAEHYWTWPTGERLFFRHFMREGDYWDYHGHAYPWQGWEELTTWPDAAGYKRMFACARSTSKGIPIKVRSTTNPYGVGHNWVKDRFKLPIPPGRMSGAIIHMRDRDGHAEPPRVAVHGHLWENKVLLHADPGYVDRLRGAARNPQEAKAWLLGDWDIVAGGMLDDLWRAEVHVVPNVPLHEIPAGWRLNRSYDHGQAKPFSVGWWAQSPGEPFQWEGRLYGAVRGDLYRIAEWYGWNGKTNEGCRLLSEDIAQGILDREDDWGIKGRVKPGPADSSIFDHYEPNKSVAGDMGRRGVRWEAADKGPGSRKQGWEQIRRYLKGALPAARGVREAPGLFVFERCDHFRRTVPVLPRSEKDPDDVDTDAEDHVGDEVRYRVRAKIRQPERRQWK